MRADALDAAFLRDVVATLGARLVVPPDLSASVDFTLAPRSAEHSAIADLAGGNAPPIAGTVTLSTTESKVVLAVSPTGATRITGGITAHDVLQAGLFAGAVRPVEGNLVIELDVLRDGREVSARGRAAAGRLTLALRDRPESRHTSSKGRA